MTRRIVFALHQVIAALKEQALQTWLWLPVRLSRRRADVGANLVVSMTSYPGRVSHAWKAIETLIRQDVSGFKLVLVLSAEEFPGGVAALPSKIRTQTRRGLEIFWVERNGRSFDKLLPIRASEPGATVITVDDDKYFPRNLVRLLVEAHSANPGHIVGSRGWRVLAQPSSGLVEFGKGWVRAKPGDQGYGLHLPGGNGCLYPPGSLAAVVDNIELAMGLCPTTDDIWFWIAAHLANTPFFCLGMNPHRPVRSQARTPALSSVNRERANAQFAAATRYFGIDPVALAWLQSAE